MRAVDGAIWKLLSNGRVIDGITGLGQPLSQQAVALFLFPFLCSHPYVDGVPAIYREKQPQYMHFMSLISGGNLCARYRNDSVAPGSLEKGGKAPCRVMVG